MNRRVALFLAALPPLFLLAMYRFFSVDYPLLDQWEFPLFLEKHFAGTLGLSDFWAFHNEHRILVPRIIMFALSLQTGWDTRFELGMNFVLGCVLFALIVVLLRRVTLHSGNRSHVFLLPLFSLLIFSVAQWQNWFLGWQLQALLSAAAVVAMVLLLTVQAFSVRHFFAAAGAAFVAVFSFANGLLALPIGLVVLACRNRWAYLSVWMVYSAVLALAYFAGYQTPAYHPDPLSGSQSWIAMPIYAAVYLGQSLVAWNGVPAALAGVAGVAASIVLIHRVWDRPMLALPMLGLVLYALGSALLTALARAGFGAEQALSPRYVTFANFLWVAVVVLLGLQTRGYLRKGLLGAIALLVLMNSLHGAYRWTERYNVYMEARPALLAGDPHVYLRYIYPDPDVLLERREILVRHGLSIFRQE